MKNFVFIAVFICFGKGTAQVGIGTTSPNPSAILDISAVDKGVLVPQVSLVGISNTTTPIVSPATGLLVWNTNASITGGSGVGFYFFNGAQWIMISSGASPIGTLDQSYDDGGAGVGRVINATDGAVNIAGDDGLEITGTYGTGDNITDGNNARMYYNPRKAAFRAGFVSGSQWNNSNVGIYSFAAGNSSSASGEAGFAGGSFSQASGRYSASFGRFTEALSYAEFAIGSYSTVYTPASALALDLTDRAFVIGNSNLVASRSNAFEVWKDGRVIINESYTLPTSDGALNQVLTTDGSGSITWQTPTLAEVDGDPSNELQSLSYNDYQLALSSGGNANLQNLINPKYPDGFQNAQPIVHGFNTGSYVVPAGKNFYITNFYSASSSASLSINSIVVKYGQENRLGLQGLTSPIIAATDATISCSIGSPTMNGFLVDANVLPFLGTGASVPASQMLVILGVQGNTGGTATISSAGVTLYQGNGNTVTTAGHNSFSEPMFIDGGQSVSVSNGIIYGYRIDK